MWAKLNYIFLFKLKKTASQTTNCPPAPLLGYGIDMFICLFIYKICSTCIRQGFSTEILQINRAPKSGGGEYIYPEASADAQIV